MMLGGLIGGVASAVGAVVSAQGQAQQLQAQRDAKRLEALNQRMKGTEEQGAKTYEALDEQKKTEQVVSNQRARFASSGGGIEGSAAYVMDKTRMAGDYKSDMVIWEGKSLKRNREVQAVQLEREAEALDQAAQTAKLSGMISGISGVAGAFGGFGKASGSSGGGGGGQLFYG